MAVVQLSRFLYWCAEGKPCFSLLPELQHMVGRLRHCVTSSAELGLWALYDLSLSHGCLSLAACQWWNSYVPFDRFWSVDILPERVGPLAGQCALCLDTVSQCRNRLPRSWTGAFPPQLHIPQFHLYLENEGSWTDPLVPFRSVALALLVLPQHRTR